MGKFKKTSLTTLLASIVFAIYWLSTPHNMADCVLDNLKDAKTRGAVVLIHRYCGEKFPK